MTAYFEARSADVFRPTEHVGGAWSADDLHVSPLIGLLVHHVQSARVGADMVIGRISVDILGRLAVGDVTLRSRCVRPGRTIELWETEASLDGRTVLAARTWWTATGDTSAVAGVEHPPLPAPATATAYPVADRWPGGYIRSIEVRGVGEPRPGRAQAWIRSGHPLVEGVPVSALASFVALVDTANGIAVRQDPTRWTFPNLDLTMHFFRQPAGEWVGFDTTVQWGADGLGLTSSVLHDETGPVGSAQQILTLRPLT